MSEGKLYVGNISSRTSRSDLQHKFEKYGPLKRSFIILLYYSCDRCSQLLIRFYFFCPGCDLLNGFAFLEYEDYEDARYSVKKMNGYSILYYNASQATLQAMKWMGVSGL